MAISNRLKLHVIPPAGLAVVLALQLANDSSESHSTPAHSASPAAASDSLIRIAEQALASGRPWRATEILTPVVRSDSLRTPAAAIIAARAATGWKGWAEVERILATEPWLDTLYGGEGRFLLARAQLESRRDSFEVAASNAALALESARDEQERAQRLVLLGRALAAARSGGAAAVAFDQAALLLPDAADWLRLRAAEWESDSSARDRLLASVTLPHARSRIPMVEALALVNAGDTAAAIAKYGAAGNRVAVLRLRSRTASSAADTALVRGDIVQALTGASPAGARQLVALLDSITPALGPGQELTVARALAASGAERGARAYAAALTAGLGGDADRFQYAGILAGLGRNALAVTEYAKVKAPPSLAAAAAYQRARTMLRTESPEAWREALRAVVRDYPTDTSAGTALYLLADLATDEGRDEAARDAFRASAVRFPGNARAATARFRAGIISYVLGDFSAAADDFAAVRSGWPASPEAIAATYWSGRARDRAGDNGAVSRACRDVVRADSLSYYALLCARRTGAAFWQPASVADSFTPFPLMDSVAMRARVLQQLGMTAELELELDRLRALAGNDAEANLAAARTLRDLGFGSRAIGSAQTARTYGAARDARLYRLLYPATSLDMVAAEAEQYALDVSLLAGLIRQESLFNPQATSPAGARGLMQVLPSVGGEVARSLAFPVWDPALLWQPDVNARIGVRHFADLVAAQPARVHVLAAYNAGSHRVARWVTKGGVDDPEVFVERIPYVETRDYVRIVTRNAEIYRALYGK